MLDDLKNILDDFGKLVRKQSRNNLTKGKTSLSGKLYQAQDYEVAVYQNSFFLKFFISPEGEAYGEFIDKGVKGAVTKSLKKPDTNYRPKQNTSPFAYRDKKPPLDKMIGFAKARKIRFRDSQGRFKKGGYKQVGFALQKSIYEKGIKPTYFFTKAFEQNFEKLPKELVDKFALDVADFMQMTIKENLQ